MYADDMVLLSKSKHGLQYMLNSLEKYCYRWRLTVNLHKTKIIVFNGKNIMCHFYFANKIVNQFDQVQYLGIVFTQNGNFKAAIKARYDKAVKAWFKLKSSLQPHYAIPPKTYVKLFDVIIKPIMLYGCEVWGAHILKIKDNTSLTSIFGNLNLLMEKLHTRVCKSVLMVPKRTNNIAVRLELGRHPLIIDIMLLVMNYYLNIVNRTGGSKIIKNTVTVQGASYNYQWYQFIRFVIRKARLYTKINSDTGKLEWNMPLIKVLIPFYEHYVVRKLQSYPKLEMYSSIKKVNRFEEYLNVLHNVELRKSYTRFRISVHDLPIERLRYTGIAREQRTCNLCGRNIGDEKHYFMYCTYCDECHGDW